MSDKWWDMSDDELDDLIREASDKVEIPFDQSSLDKLRQKIDPKPVIIPPTRFKYERGLLFLLLLLCFVGGGIGYFVSRNNVSEQLTKQVSEKENERSVSKTLSDRKTGIEEKNQPEKLAEELSSTGESTSSNSIQHKNTSTKEASEKANVVSNPENKTIVKNTNKEITKQKLVAKDEQSTLSKSELILVKKKKTSNLFNNNNQKSISTEQKNIEVLSGQNELINVDNSKSIKEFKQLALLANKPIKDLRTKFDIILPEFEENNNEPIVSPLVKSNKFSRFGVRLSIAPDANGVESLAGFALGKSAGILFEYNITKRIVIQTGAIYSSKKYSTGIENYHAWAKNWATRPVLPTSVEGDCQILDIPFNIRYNLLQKPKNTWFVSAGVSSYLMLTEGYEYYYPEGVTVPTNFPRSVSWKRDNDYFMSSLNISFGFEKRINQHISIQAEPYLKTPLKEVGRGKVNLYSSGIMFSLKYGF